MHGYVRIRVPSLGQLVAGNEEMQKGAGISVQGLGLQVVVEKTGLTLSSLL